MSAAAWASEGGLGVGVGLGVEFGVGVAVAVAVGVAVGAGVNVAVAVAVAVAVRVNVAVGLGVNVAVGVGVNGAVAVAVVQDRLGCRIGQFKLCAYFLDLRRLLFWLCRFLVKHIRGKRESPLQFQARFFDCL